MVILQSWSINRESYWLKTGIVLVLYLFASIKCLQIWGHFLVGMLEDFGVHMNKEPQRELLDTSLEAQRKVVLVLDKIAFITEKR